METFEFVVTSIARVALKEHVKIQAEGVEDANSIRNLWRRLIFQSTYQIGKVLQL